MPCPKKGADWLDSGFCLVRRTDIVEAYRNCGSDRPTGHALGSVISRSAGIVSPNTAQAERMIVILARLLVLSPTNHPGANSAALARSGRPGFIALGMRAITFSFGVRTASASAGNFSGSRAASLPRISSYSRIVKLTAGGQPADLVRC